MLSYKTIKTDNIVKIIREKGSNISYYHIDNTCANDLWAVGDSAEDYIRYVLKEIAFWWKDKFRKVLHAIEKNKLQRHYNARNT